MFFSLTHTCARSVCIIFFASALFGQLALVSAQEVRTPLNDHVMQGFPPSPEDRVTKVNAFSPAKLRWVLNFSREFAPTRSIRRSSQPMELREGVQRSLDTLKFSVNQEEVTLKEYLTQTSTDGLIVLHKGQVIYERNFGRSDSRQPHIWASMTKSVTGLLATQFIVEGLMDPNAKLAIYVPELTGTPFGESTVQQNLDMEVGVLYPEAIPPDLGLFAAADLIPRREGMPDDIYSFLRVAAAPKESISERRYYYQNGSAEAVAWALRKIANKSWAELVSQRLWSRFAFDDAYVHIDRLGTEMASGGLAVGLHDTARFAGIVLQELIRKDAGDSLTRAVREIVKPNDNQDLFARGNLATGRPGYSYHNYWYMVNDHMGSIEASGRFGHLC
jgi:CubicO group peptidase (beta-lactamase class C family)